MEQQHSPTFLDRLGDALVSDLPAAHMEVWSFFLVLLMGFSSCLAAQSNFNHISHVWWSVKNSKIQFKISTLPFRCLSFWRFPKPWGGKQMILNHIGQHTLVFTWWWKSNSTIYLCMMIQIELRNSQCVNIGWCSPILALVYFSSNTNCFQS